MQGITLAEGAPVSYGLPSVEVCSANSHPSPGTARTGLHSEKKTNDTENTEIEVEAGKHKPVTNAKDVTTLTES